MKRIKLSKEILAGAMVCGLAVCASAGVVAYWPFGTNELEDASGNGHRLVKSDAGVIITNGMAILDGSQTTFSTALPLDLSGYANLTIECWMRTKDATGTRMLLEHTEDYNSNPGSFVIDISEGGLIGNAWGGFCTADGFNLDQTAPNVANSGGWHHVALVYDSSKAGAERSVLYFDRVAQSTWFGFSQDAATAFRNAYLYIGSRANSQYKFIGDLDDIRISDAALTTNDFLQARSVADVNVIAYWPFDRGIELADASGNMNTLATGGGVVFSDGMASLDGSAQMTFNTAQPLDLSGCSNLTIECWMRTSDAATTTRMLLEHTEVFNSNPGGFIIDITDGGIIGNALGGFRDDIGFNLDQTEPNVANDGEWHHIALVYDSSKAGADRSVLYFDRVAQSTFADNSSDAATAFRNAYLYIGSRANNQMKFIGDLDDIRISDAALATNQFLQARTAGTLPPKIIAYWPFARGNEKADATGRNHTLAVLGDGEVGFRDGMAVFQGHSGLYTPGPVDLSGYRAVTIECFVRSVVTNTAPMLIEMSGNLNNVFGAFAVSAGMLFPDTMGAGYRTSTGYNIEEAAKGSITDGAWHHIAYVIDLNAPSGADRTRLYLDGTRQTKNNSYADGTATPLTSDQSIFLGWRYNLTSLNFVGEMDDVRISGAALAPNEFMALSARTADPAANAVIAYWPFNASDGLADVSGNGHTLENDGVVFTGGAAVFDGAQIMKTASPLALHSYSAVTVEYFIRTTAAGVDIVLEQSSDYNSHLGAFISYFGETGVGALVAGYRTTWGSNLEATSMGAVTDGRWHHVALVIDSSKSGADRAQLYFDYVRQAKFAPQYNDASVTPFIDDYLYIGARVGKVAPLVGSLADVRITGKALGVAEFLKRPTVALPTVVAYWPFTPKHELEDASGNGYLLTNSGVTFNAISGSAVFSGSQEAFNTVQKLDLRWHDALTVECFVRSASTETQMAFGTTACAPLNQGAFNVAMYYDAAGMTESEFTTARVLFNVNGGSECRHNVDRNDAGKVVTDGMWHHLALVIDPAKAGAHRSTLYIDWVPQTVSVSASDLVTDFLDATLYIGSRANNEYKFTGEMDDIRISSAALAPSQFLMKRTIPRGTLLTIQ